jgi:hypothetical protein
MPDFETIRDAKADLVLAHLHFAVLFDSLDNPAVATLEDATSGDLDIPETAESSGIIEKKAGVSLTHTIDSNDVEGYGEAEPVRTIISKRTVDFDAEYLETNKVVLEKFWGTVFDDTNLDVSAHGGVTIKAPTLPKNVFYRAYLVATDDVNGDDLFAYYIMPRVKLIKVDNQDSKDNDAVAYKMTFRAFRDSTMGFSVLQGWCGPGWRKLVHKTGFVAAPTAIEATPDTATVDISDDTNQQITVTGDNGINYTPDATFVSSDPTKATVSASGLVEPVAAGSVTVTVTLTGFTASPLTDTVSVTVTA